MAIKGVSPSVPERTPRFPLTRIVYDVLSDVEKNIERQKKLNPAYRDDNFLRLVQVVRKSLVVLMDDDPIYRQWIAYAIQELNKELEFEN